MQIFHLHFCFISCYFLLTRRPKSYNVITLHTLCHILILHHGGNVFLWLDVFTWQPVVIKHTIRDWAEGQSSFIGWTKPGLTLQDFCRTTDQIGYDMKRQVIAEDRDICLKAGPLLFTISHYTMRSPEIRRNLLEICDRVILSFI